MRFLQAGPSRDNVVPDRQQRSPGANHRRSSSRTGHHASRKRWRRENKTEPPAASKSMRIIKAPSIRGARNERCPLARVFAGKMIVVTEPRCVPPLERVRSARHGPRGICPSSSTRAISESLGASKAPSVKGNGPAERPPGPSERVSSPLMERAAWPTLWTLAATSGSPFPERLDASWPIVNSAAGKPPFPTETYIRTPTLLTSRTPLPVGDGAETSAQTTA